MFSIVIQIFVLFHSVSSRKCDKDFDIRLNTVILTHVSENNGAAFIHKLSADSLEECIKYCCGTIECTVGVFGPKRGSKCFLFNCHEPNICNFTSDLDYTVFVQRTWLPEQRNVHKVATWSSGSLFGLCGPRDPCVVANTICDSGRCVCKSGFIEKWRKCGRVPPSPSSHLICLVPSICSKPELEFQCDDATSCIAIYDVCNRIAECPDASDESLCGEAEPVNSVSTHKVESQSSPGSRTLNARTLLPRGDDEHDLSEVDFESSKVRSLRTLHFGRDSPIHRTYEGKEVYFPPSYLTSSLETDVPSLMLTGARGKSVFPGSGVSTFLEQPEHLRSRSGYRSHLSGGSRFSVEGASLEHHRRKIGRLSTQAHGTLVEDFDGEAEEYNIPHYRGSGFDREHKVLRHRVRPLAEHSDLKSDDKHRIDKYHEEAKNSAMRPKMPAAPVIGLYSQSGYQWHTAAILLAVGLGLTSCLFGLLVSRCRQRGRFDQGGPRSKAVATNHLRQRILRTRGLSSNDLERSGLLSKLQL
ncbi:unnamed protein product [Taenia asiatica]|uniref:MANSC domain-containing protein n=1 Tax=Taenia asiatica TaxID=60517 RepID=A0A0R3VV93_TAEAS|nr:unnamed protein product [Taenia asiatica]